MRGMLTGVGLALALMQSQGATAQERGGATAERNAGTEDAERAKAIAAQLRADPRLRDDAVKVDVAGTIVMLVGQVDSEREKQHAEELVRQTDPTAAVQNFLKTEKEELARRDRAADGSITDSLKARLSADGAVDASAVAVDTVRNVVTLRGQVRTEEARKRVIQHARHTDGVLVVVDEMTVAGAEGGFSQPNRASTMPSLR